METTFEKVKAIFEEFGFADSSADDIKPETHIRDLGLDSLDDVEIVMAIEEDFVVEVEDEDAEKWITIQDIVNYIEEKKK